MLENSVIYLGLAGTSKSSELYKIAKGHSSIPLFLCFNRFIKRKVINKQGFDKNYCFTIHSICYQILKSINNLPKCFYNKNINLEKVDFDLLVDTFLNEDNILNENTEFLFNIIDLIIIDEFQDIIINDKYIRVINKLITSIKLLRGVLPKLAIAGDSTQEIYGFSYRSPTNKSDNLYQEIKKAFPEYTFDVKYLNKNYRTKNKSLDYFLNSYLKNNIKKIDANLLYNLDHSANKSSIYDKPVRFYVFHELSEEWSFVFTEIEEKYKEKNVVIISRNKDSFCKLEHIYSNLLSVNFGKEEFNLFKEYLKNTVFNDGGEDIEDSFFYDFDDIFIFEKGKYIINIKNIFELYVFLDAFFDFYQKEKGVWINNYYKNKKTLFEQVIEKLNFIRDKKPNYNMSTIHKQKGLEADVVFVVAFQKKPFSDPNINIDEIKTYFVAFSRPSEELIITTSENISETEIRKIFGSDESILVIENREKELTKLLSTNGEIDFNKRKNFSKKRLLANTNSIDSICFFVDNPPFHKYIKNDLKRKNCPVNILKTQKIIVNDFTYFISFNNKMKRYYFDFTDLKHYQKLVLSDYEITKRCIDYIILCFGKKISLDNIFLYSIDVQEFSEFSSSSFREKFLYLLNNNKTNSSYKISEKGEMKFEEAEELISDNNYTSVCLKRNYRIIEDNLRKIDFGCLDSTFYFNTKKPNKSGIKAKIYNPKEKNNSNKTHIDRLMKTEYRVNCDQLKQKKFLGKNISAEELKKESDLKRLLKKINSGIKDYYKSGEV